MTTALSKRHQARNEKALQELIKMVPGNDRCADCQVKNPGWASWSLGIFLCMRCASLHRKLGTHISKVKSLSMDSWSNDQVDSMKRNGNVNSNRTYNPRNMKPSIPLDVDEVDAALERFIRQKYDQRIFSAGAIQSARRNDTGSTRSSDEQPPPLPPKPVKRIGFGLRSVSSALTLSKPTLNSPPKSPDVSGIYRFPPSPIRVNKQSRVFGASVGGDSENLDYKLATLRDMGFPDDPSNLTVLKGAGGDLNRAIESLVRLAEGSTPTSRSRTPMQVKNVAVSQPLPVTKQQLGLVGNNQTSASGSVAAPQVAQEKRLNSQDGMQSQEQTVRDFTSTNPFEPPQFSAPQSGQPQSQLHSASFNLEQSFQNMQISQPLFPNATGGYPSQHQQLQEARFQQSMTPPVPPLPHQNIQTNPYAQHFQLHNGNYNPFSQIQQTNTIPPSQNPNPTHQQFLGASQYSNTYSSNITPQPVQQSPTNGHPSQPAAGYFQSQQQTYNQFSLPSQGLAPSNPYAILPQSPISPSQNPFQQHQSPNPFPPQPLQPQRTGRFDKSSILALYNYPQLAPQPLSPPPSSNPVDIKDNYNNNNYASNSSSSPPNEILSTLSESIPSKSAQRSVTMPVLSSGNRNPFSSSTTATTTAIPRTMAIGSPLANSSTSTATLSRHVSQESVDIGGLQNGRHSPDAFASLSARFVVR